MSEGKKDEGKNRLDLVYPILIEQVGRVRTFAVTSKYGDPENWKTIDNLIPRYTAAAMRHFEAWRSGEKIDKESGLSHLAHCACNIMFLMEWERLHEEKKTTINSFYGRSIFDRSQTDLFRSPEKELRGWSGLATNHDDADLHTNKNLGDKKEIRDENVDDATKTMEHYIASVFENDIELYLKICQILGEKW